MSSFISEELIERVSSHFDIVDIISQYTPLKKAGRNYKALCPFHEEKTPSFVVSPEKQLFHCFGCGVGGNLFTFLMKWEKITFPEAVKMVAEKVGISIPILDTEKNQKAIREFGLGYAPPSGDFLKLARQKGISLENLKQSNLVVTSQGKEGCYAWFRSRLIFPIFNTEERICGFAGRVLDNSLPKYVNSPQSLIFDKGKILYGLNFSKEAVRKKEEMILVEGYTDVIALHQAGIENVVASMGTSLTPSQARLIKRHSDRVFIAYDQDKAGIAATLRSFDLLMNADLQVDIINMPQGMDPEELVRKEGIDSFLERKKRAISYFDYRLDMAISDRSSLARKDKGDIIAILFSILEKTKLERRQEMIRKLSQRLDLDEESLRAELSKLRGKERGFFSRREFLEIEDKQMSTEKALLQLMLNEKAIIKMVKESECIENFIDSSHRKIAEEIIASLEEGEISSSRLINRLGEEKFSSLISSFSLSEELSQKEDKEQVAIDFINYLQKNKKQRRFSEVRKKIKESEEEGEKIDKWLYETIELNQFRKSKS
jgi:DNA primase